MVNKKFDKQYTQAIVDELKVLENELEFGFCESREDYESCFQLAYRELSDKSLIKRNDHGLRVSIYQCLPYTNVCFVKDKNGNLLATATIVGSNSLGLPIEKSKIVEAKNSYAAEITDIATNSLTNHDFISFLLVKYCSHLALDCFGYDQVFLCSEENAMARVLVASGFQNNSSQPINYHYHQSRPLLLLHRQSQVMPDENTYFESNIIGFFEGVNLSSMEFPSITLMNTGIRSMTPEDFNYFFNEKTDLLKRSSDFERRILNNYYVGSTWASKYIPESSFISNRLLPRLNVSYNATTLDIDGEPTESALQVISIARNGLAIKADESIKLGKPIPLRVELGPLVMSDVILEATSSYNNVIAGTLKNTDRQWRCFISKLYENLLQENSHQFSSGF
ncbi:MAG: hypothetical protein AB8E15_11280 [Bdellovibrionales bacterium]